MAPIQPFADSASKANPSDSTQITRVNVLPYPPCPRDFPQSSNALQRHQKTLPLPLSTASTLSTVASARLTVSDLRLPSLNDIKRSRVLKKCVETGQSGQVDKIISVTLEGYYSFALQTCLRAETLNRGTSDSDTIVADSRTTSPRASLTLHMDSPTVGISKFHEFLRLGSPAKVTLPMSDIHQKTSSAIEAEIRNNKITGPSNCIAKNKSKSATASEDSGSAYRSHDPREDASLNGNDISRESLEAEVGFRCFAKLPLIVRNAIWKYAIPPRIISIDASHTFDLAPGCEFTSAFFWTKNNTIPARSISSACRESRDVWKQEYPMIPTSTLCRTSFYFNAKNDVVCLLSDWPLHVIRELNGVLKSAGSDIVHSVALYELPGYTHFSQQDQWRVGNQDLKLDEVFFILGPDWNKLNHKVRGPDYDEAVARLKSRFSTGIGATRSYFKGWKWPAHKAVLQTVWSKNWPNLIHTMKDSRIRSAA